MAKKRKTRKQKVLAENREQTKRQIETVLLQQETVRLSLPQSQRPAVPTVSRMQSTVVADYHHLTTDLRKTFLLTASVVVTELLMRFFIRN